MTKRLATCESAVEVYLTKVTRMLDEFPEKGRRELKWVSCEDAAKRLREPLLAKRSKTAAA